MKGKDRQEEMGCSFLPASMMRVGGDLHRKGKRAWFPSLQLYLLPVWLRVMSESRVHLWKSFRGVKVTQVCTGVQLVE